MKKLLLISLLTLTTSLFSQSDKAHPFFTGDLNFTLGINEDYELFNDDDESMLKFSALMFRVGAGYQFDKRWAAIFNIGYDHHTRFNINSIPTYGTLRYNISNDGYDSFFTEVSYGKMWRPSHKYENGNYYKFGFGFQIGSSSHWHAVLKLDFHRKKIAHFKNGNLDSLSFGIGFSFF
ncbi:hypothetical protein [Tenacibaculum sp. nBUS_03]|uniref:hypothetical protein n=1 Tax=Tenacibaculum sp. nBUS_03 TaxID=3395320 RepID=UPI003EB84EAE